MSFFLVLSTAGSEREGQRIGKALVEKRLAACVNVLPGATSLYYWEGKLCQENETVLLIKTAKRNLEKIVKRIRAIHSYSVPEILFVRVDGGDEDYLKWAQKMVGQGPKNRSKKIIDNKRLKR